METVIVILLWAAPFLFVVFLINQTLGAKAVALRELAKMYARGEVSEEEYETRRIALKRLRT